MLQLLINLVSWIIIIRSIRSWAIINYTDADIVFFQLTEPLMIRIRHYIPIIGGIDFSGMIAILLLYIFNCILKDLFPSFNFYL
ncbi:YggT family protein [Candidatus Tachikawaea gelatinosa]|uniref:YggT family protein n=1 Tax=Candidatus Tachikawaea gelatinosa TaxID=1410383 RepID=UPI001E5A668E|nr:YggT family protein [Candidatus Tachikawaea gelatinosa]